MKTLFTDAQLRTLVPGPGQDYDWLALCALIPGLLELERTPQDPVYHAEGNVGIHTRVSANAQQDA